jgi:hypothetical protein
MKMFLQNASFFAKCKLHLARFAVDQTADAVGKRGGFMQFPMLWSECIQHGNPLSGRKRQLVEKPLYFDPFGQTEFTPLAII